MSVHERGARFVTGILTLLLGIGPVSAQTSLLDRGREAFYEGRVVAAVENLETYLRVDPRNHEARILLARALTGAGRNDESFAQLKRVLEEDPVNADALFYLASLSLALSQTQYGRLYELAPESARVHQLMAQSFELRERFEEAEEEYQKALAVDPGLTEVITALGDLSRTLGKFAEATERYRRALAADPSDYRALYGLGVCRRFDEDHPGARDYFERSLALAPGFAPGHLALGMTLLRMGDARGAVAPLLEAIRLEPDLDQAYFQLGQAYQRLGRTDEARLTLDKARELRMKNLLRFR